ncbi:hypothetical protein CEXT_50431 [Caerostris extrusa]|uniref:Uncharacterized protein n=1 Tax=Caerostris extrusa TaxID=172846 RepID=A0AAV4V208_CAEEX|nr:hypothetical protein CEXT_50431 [Caerostris extrusa]
MPITNLLTNGYKLVQLHVFNQLERVDDELSKSQITFSETTLDTYIMISRGEPRQNGGGITKSSEFMHKSAIGYNGIQRSCICDSNRGLSDISVTHSKTYTINL